MSADYSAGVVDASAVQAGSHVDAGAKFQNDSLHEEPDIVEKHEDEIPTMSHELANVDHEEKGVAQQNYGQTEAKDLGWTSKASEVPSPLVHGLSNEELWTLIRRFNKARATRSILLYEFHADHQ